MVTIKPPADYTEADRDRLAESMVELQRLGFIVHDYASMKFAADLALPAMAGIARAELDVGQVAAKLRTDGNGELASILDGAARQIAALTGPLGRGEAAVLFVSEADRLAVQAAAGAVG